MHNIDVDESTSLMETSQVFNKIAKAKLDATMLLDLKRQMTQLIFEHEIVEYVSIFKNKLKSLMSESVQLDTALLNFILSFVDERQKHLLEREIRKQLNIDDSKIINDLLLPFCMMLIYLKTFESTSKGRASSLSDKWTEATSKNLLQIIDDIKDACEQKTAKGVLELLSKFPQSKQVEDLIKATHFLICSELSEGELKVFVENNQDKIIEFANSNAVVKDWLTVTTTCLFSEIQKEFITAYMAKLLTPSGMEAYNLRPIWERLLPFVLIILYVHLFHTSYKKALDIFKYFELQGMSLSQEFAALQTPDSSISDQSTVGDENDSSKPQINISVPKKTWEPLRHKKVFIPIEQTSFDSSKSSVPSNIDESLMEILDEDSQDAPPFENFEKNAKVRSSDIYNNERE